MDAYYSQRGQGPKIGQNDHDTREPDAVKAASPVRRGAVRKGLTDDTSLSKTGTVYGSISTSLAAYSTKLVTAALEWSYEAGGADVKGETLELAAQLLVLRRDTLRMIDGAGPDAPTARPEEAASARANGTEEERETGQESEQQNTTKTAETVQEQGQTSTSPKCTFSRTVIPIDLKRWTESSVTLAECPDCGRTRSLSPSKGVLRFPPHERRKQQTRLSSTRWSATGKTDWGVVGAERK